METIAAYRTADGIVFEDLKEATTHERIFLFKQDIDTFTSKHASHTISEELSEVIFDHALELYEIFQQHINVEEPEEVEEPEQNEESKQDKKLFQYKESEQDEKPEQYEPLLPFHLDPEKDKTIVTKKSDEMPHSPTEEEKLTNGILRKNQGKEKEGGLKARLGI